MIIQYIWEEPDIKSGRYVILDRFDGAFKKVGEDRPNIGYACSIAYKVGWIHARHGDKDTGPRYCLVSITDGMIREIGNVTKMVAHLNDPEDRYRPMTGPEVDICMNHLRMQNAGWPEDYT